MKRSLCSILALLALSVLAAPAFAGDSPVLASAVQDYNQKKYRDALSKLDGLSRGGQANDKAHYYMALCYQGINQMATAKSEYMWVYSKGRDATLKYNAWQALKSMDKWSQHRAYSGQGNNFDRASPANTVGQQFRANRTAEEARLDAEAARKSSGGG
ncbi:MAG: hypothetical protein K2W95_09415 [Candidatus Obscuribacterales bacterium]|nr:hypothetical protein [Candidatus Obscuribacterales bacterium]